MTNVRKNQVREPTIVVRQNLVSKTGKREESHVYVSVATSTQKQEGVVDRPFCRQAKQTTPLHGNTSDLLTLEVLIWKSFVLIQLKSVRNLVELFVLFCK